MNKVVIGLGFGDEGKGLVTDWLCKSDPSATVVRYSGGHQAGHCVRTKTEKHIFSNFGSGTLRGNPTSWLAKTCDPVGFCNEYELIKDYSPQIFIDPLCPITTPYDKEINRMDDDTSGHGSVGVGFGSTIQREEDNYHLYFHDLRFPTIRNQKLSAIAKHYHISLEEGYMEEFIDCCDKMISICTNYNSSAFADNKIYESSQGLMLDMDYGIFPHVTRSKLGTQELGEVLNEVVNEDGDIADTEFFLVTRAYQTRHGNGPCESEKFTPVNADETNQSDGFQGVFKTRVLNLDTLAYAITVDPVISNSYRNLVITCLDHLDTYSFIWKDRKMTFKTEKAFLQSMICRLPRFNNIYLSHGPTAEDITQYKYGV